MKSFGKMFKRGKEGEEEEQQQLQQQQSADSEMGGDAAPPEMVTGGGGALGEGVDFPHADDNSDSPPHHPPPPPPPPLPGDQPQTGECVYLCVRRADCVRIGVCVRSLWVPVYV